MSQPNVKERVSRSISTTVADMADDGDDDDSVQSIESDWSEEEASGEGETKCDYCCTPMEGPIGAMVECNNCEWGCKIIRGTRFDESSEASSATITPHDGDLPTLEVIATPQVDDHADPPRPDNEAERPTEPRKTCAPNTQGAPHDETKRSPRKTAEARGTETEYVKFTHVTDDEVQVPLNAEAAVKSN